MLGTFLRTKFFEWKEQIWVSKNLYQNPTFKEKDIAFHKAYRHLNPYKISKKFLAERGETDVHVYGETPLTTMVKIVHECGITDTDKVVELGAGRGRAALFLSEYVGCSVIAYEQIPLFVAEMQRLNSPQLEMVLGDMHKADFTDTTFIYLYGTMLADQEIEQLAHRFPKQAKIITVSYPLSDYSKNYETLKSFKGRFAWGETEIYLNGKRANS